MFTQSTPTKPRSKGASTSNEDINNNTVEVRSYTYRPQFLHIRASFDQSLSAFTMPIPTLNLLNPGTRRPLEVSALVFNAQRDKVLLLQRIHEPNTWEVPSFSIFEGEKSALHAVVRTVHQCSGQIVRKITRGVGYYEYESSPPWPPCRRYCFVAEVDHPEEEEVALWLEIYQSFAWVTVEEVNEEKYGRDKTALDFHAPALRWIIQKAFRVLREQQEEEEEEEREREEEEEEEAEREEECVE
ncbi:hypothetical protein PG994_011876 [Apiospora phragmitis]|uniref:Nudix hydrolase domain-containing protein n=1 Tax=Apiospora phragmitis TaxID=2905665 RepID=A0ABR1TU23_9PEZI